jgi:sugar lactone lactonase YvrE
MMRLIPAAVLLTLSCHATTIETVAGTGKAGYSGDGRQAAKAELNQPFGLTIAPDGDLIFCDTNNHVIRRITKKSGIIRTIVGSGKTGYSGDGGRANQAELNEPYEVIFHPDGDLYWVERMNHVVRRMDHVTGKIITIAGTGDAGFSGDGGPGNKASMNQPHSIAFDREAKHLFICDIKNHRIRRVELASGIIDTWCGTGKANDTPDGAPVSPKTPLKGPRALALAPDGDLWLALREGNAVYRIDMKTTTLHHVAGTGEPGFTGNGGPAKEATIAGPKGIVLSPDGKLVYLADTETHTVRAIDLSKTPPVLELVAGDGTRGDGPDSPDPLKCKMARLHGLAIDPKTGDLYIGDSENHKIRVVR